MTRDLTSLVTAVFEDPDDDARRVVAADALLEAGSPWGELINLQLKKKPSAADKKLAQVLAKRHRDVIGGPLAKIASTTNRWVCEKGFLVECDLSRRLVKRPDFDAAAKAPQWATVRRVSVSILTTPIWWLQVWMKNPATKNLREIDLSNLDLARTEPGSPWRVTKCTDGDFYGKYLAAFATGLSNTDRARIEFASNVRPGTRAKLEAALKNVTTR